MDIKEIYEQLHVNMPELDILKDEPMSKHNSFRVGGNADIFIKVNTLEELKYILKFIKQNNIPLTILGNGSNVLVKDNGIRGITITLKGFNQININENKEDVEIEVGSSVKLGMLSSVCLKNEITGLEFASGIPGTIGGAIRMNAGAYGGEMKEIVSEVTYMNEDGEILTLKKEDINFSYRQSRFKNTQDIIISAKLELKKGKKEEMQEKIETYRKQRQEKQPIDMPSAGSTFKRGNDFISAQLIDQAGLKGFQIGGAQVSSKHAGFIVNTGNATAQDILDLIDYIIKVVYEKFGKILELEIEVIGE